MKNSIKNIVGSPSRDVFKWLHKRIFPSEFYASDLDLILIDFRKGIIAILDYKENEDSITKTESELYDRLIGLGFHIFLVKNESHSLGSLKNLVESLYKVDSELQESVAKTVTQKGLHILENSVVFEYCRPNGKVALSLVANNYVEWEHDLRRQVSPQ